MNLKKDKGVTLVEVIVSVVIFTITIVAGFSFFVFGHRDTLNVQQTDYALQYIVSDFERWRGIDYEAIPESYSSTEDKLGAQFSFSYSATEVDLSTEAYKKVLATATWGSRQITLGTIIADDER